jgi:hypothetical protein
VESLNGGLDLENKISGQRDLVNWMFGGLLLVAGNTQEEEEIWIKLAVDKKGLYYF